MVFLQCQCVTAKHQTLAGSHASMVCQALVSIATISPGAWVHVTPKLMDYLDSATSTQYALVPKLQLTSIWHSMSVVYRSQWHQCWCNYLQVNVANRPGKNLCLQSFQNFFLTCGVWNTHLSCGWLSKLLGKRLWWFVCCFYNIGLSTRICILSWVSTFNWYYVRFLRIHCRGSMKYHYQFTLSWQKW